jgi:hypothetical protein
MVHAHYVLDNQGYKHTLRMCNTYCSSTATMVTRTLLVFCFTYIVRLAFVVPAVQLTKDAASFEAHNNCLKWLVSSEATRTSLGGNSGPTKDFVRTSSRLSVWLFSRTVRKAVDVRAAIRMSPGRYARDYAKISCPQDLMTDI